MKFQYGVGHGTTATESGRSRWLAVLLAFLLVVAMVLVAMSPAFGDDDGDDDDDDDGTTITTASTMPPTTMPPTTTTTIPTCEATLTCVVATAGFTGTITCDATCGVVTEEENGMVNENGDFLRVVVSEDPEDPLTFTIVMESDGKGTSPGKASVDIDGASKFPNGPLPLCGKKGTEPTTNCVHINRINGNHTQYTVFFDDDPRFRFR